MKQNNKNEKRKRKLRIAARKRKEHTEKYTISLPFSGGPKAFPPKSPTRIIAVVLESRKSYLIKKETGRTPIKT